MNIELRVENERGCGRRKPGGLYLVSGQGFWACGKLPIELGVCPTCHAGIKPARGWTWVGKQLVNHATCRFLKDDPTKCVNCKPFDGSVDQMGLLWVGEKFYKTPEEFMREAINMGISRRIANIPNDFVLGETWVLLAHRRPEVLMEDSNPLDKPPKPVKVTVNNPVVFSAFKPERIEYVVKDDDPEDKLERLEKKGITLVKVIPNDLFTAESRPAGEAGSGKEANDEEEI